MDHEPWRRNLYIMFAVELFVLMSFSFTAPFLPMMIESIGNFTVKEAAKWSGVAGGIMGIGMFLTGPIWGIMADRWGRKPMVLRAMFGITALSAAIALIPNVYWLVILRGAMGLFAGSMASASALVASTTPREKIPFAMGLLMVASFAGSALGPLVGGVMADALGYWNVFYVIAGMYFLGGVAVLLFAREKFVPVPKERIASFGKLFNLARSQKILPLLIVLTILSLSPSVVMPVIPLFIQQLSPQNAASAAGLAMSIVGIVAAGSSIVAGRIGERVSMKKMLIFGCLTSGLLYFPPMFAPTIFLFIVLLSLRGLTNGAIMVPSNALIALSVSAEEQGMAYGLQQSASSFGYGIGPIMGGALASVAGLQSVFPVTAVLFVIAGLLVIKLLPEMIREQQPEPVSLSGRDTR
jgi:DHA1 family multidrug resistance protein-like MFS transporter